jgi:hypothetical protein
MANRPKLRIQLLDEALVTKSDRLVDQYSELLNGPSEKHKGPIKIEATLIDRDTTERFKQYLDKLVGDLPVIVKNKTSKEAVNPFKEIYLDIKKRENIEDIIEYLESINFRWVNFQFLEELASIGKFDTNLGNVLKNYQWLVRMTRQAKDPANDKFDFTMMVGINFFSHKDKVFVVFKNKIKAKWVKVWKKEKNLNMKKKKTAMVFPQYMSIEERKQWRYMHRKVILGKDLGPRESQFYNRYKAEIKNIPAEVSKKD